MTYDYIIAGAGSAGCIIANRLSASGQYSVLLLEAGGKDSSLWFRIGRFRQNVLQPDL